MFETDDGSTFVEKCMNPERIMGGVHNRALALAFTGSADYG